MLRSATRAGHATARSCSGDRGSTRRSRTPTLSQSISVWRNAPFLRFWAGSSISTVGSQVTYLALPWLVLQLTHSPFQLGVVGALEFLPFLLFGLIVGVYADRWDRRVILLAADLVRFGVLASVPLAAAFQVLTILQLYLVAFVAGTARVWFEVTHYSLIPDLVTRERVVDGNSSLEVTEGASTLIGPSLGGLLIKLFGAANAILADALSFLLASIAWFSLGSRRPTAPPAEVGWRAQLVAGLRWVAGQRVILENLASAVVLNIVFMSVESVFVFYAQHELHFDAARTGLVLGIGGGGPIIFAALAPALRRRFRMGQLLVANLLLTGPMIAMLDVAPVLAAAPAFILVAASQGVLVGLAILGRILLRSYVQASTPPAILARVNASLRMVSWGSVPVGAFLGGALTQLLGIRWVIALASGLSLLLFAVFAVGSETKRI